MKIEALKQRLECDRPMTSVTILMPEDVVEDLKKVAPLLGFSGYQPLMRAYIGQCLHIDLERFESETVTALIASLKRLGVSDAVLDEAKVICFSKLPYIGISIVFQVMKLDMA
jgi:serine protease inhibitor